MSSVVIELDDAKLRAGFVTVTKIDSKGQRKGQMDLKTAADLLNEVFHFEAVGRRVAMVTRFGTSELIAFGANGPKWQAVQEIPPATYYLVSATGKAYEVKLPRLVVFVGSHINWPKLFWTPAEQLAPTTILYPLIIGNTYPDGRVCTGNTGLKCKSPEDITPYVRKLVESPASHTVTKHTDRLYKALTKQWATGIGKRHGITLEKLLASTE